MQISGDIAENGSEIADWNLIVSPQEEKLPANISSSALEEKIITAISRFLELYNLSLFIRCDIKR